MRKAHRIAWILTNGEPSEGAQILHRCDNPPCCNPAHLFPGTHQDNMADRNAKGRTTAGRHHGAHGEQSHLAKLTLPDVRAIRRAYAAGGVSQSALGAQYGVSQTQVGRIVRGVRWARDI
jgi:hypothetical protein